MRTLQRHWGLAWVLCFYLLSMVSAQTTDDTGGDDDSGSDGSWEWKPLVIALGAVAGTMLVIVNIIIIVRCCGCCQEGGTVDKRALARGNTLRDSKRSDYSDPSYYRGHGPLPYRLRPEVAAALNPPRDSEVVGHNVADSISIDDRPPVPPPNRDQFAGQYSNAAFMDLADTAEPYRYDNNTSSAAAYSSIPRDINQPMAMVAVPRPMADGPIISSGVNLVTNTMNAEIYPDVNGDDYLMGRFRPPTERT